MTVSVRQTVTTFLTVVVTLIVMTLILHARNGLFSITRAEVIHQAILGLAVTAALVVTGRGK